MLYNEHEFLDRFAAAAADGFKAVEYLFPYAWSAPELARRLADNGLQQVLFNAPPPATGTPASAAPPACPAARPSSAPACSRRWSTLRCWPARAST
jgi:hydroxypyruvate isomerase